MRSRRKFLENAVALGAGTALSSAQGTLAQVAPPQPAGADVPLAVPPWSRKPGAPTGSHPYGAPSSFEKNVVRSVRPTDKQYISSSSRTPLQDLDGILTPNGLFYERHHGGVPDIDPARHRLLVHGLVAKELLFTVDDLRRFPSVSRIHFLECSGNPGYDVHGKTAAEANGLLSCAEWTGVALKTVLEEVGLQPGARWAVAEGADASGMTRSVPIEKCLEDALLVYSQNGERLRPEQGYPLRLLLPGFEGNMSVKWLRRLHITDTPAFSREETAKYTDSMPDGTARQFTFYMEAKSIITAPSGGQRLNAPGFVEIRGIAWSGRGKVARVEVSVDGGDNWHDAALQDPVLTRAVTRFRFPWRWDGGPAVIQSRATDETGYVQPTLEALLAVRGVNSGYHNNAITPWRIASNGEVSNARL
ncbi:sulfite dehydrogenase [Bordetella genomosp. 8]|uniref:sulfite dehydrogenase n=1 Tax=Bordetella genomosp. 8 TaxID=1416806 RepID=UPI001E52ABF6|nr:sulfite dehydrogenase [Bordetella genomosp. 8]